MTGAAGCFLIGVLVGAPLSLTQGATIAMTIREVPRRGATAGLYAAIGGTMADLLVFAFLATIVATNPDLFLSGETLALTLGGLSAAALLVLGLRLMTGAGSDGLHRDRGDALLRAYHENPVLDRLWGALLSPAAHFFWWSAGLGLLATAWARGEIRGMIWFASGFLVFGLLWPTFVALRLSRPEAERALSDRQLHVVTSLGGLALSLVGLLIGAEAFLASSLPASFTRIAEDVFR